MASNTKIAQEVGPMNGFALDKAARQTDDLKTENEDLRAAMRSALDALESERKFSVLYARVVLRRALED